MSKPSADARLQRLLVMVPWVSQQDGPTVEEVCARFGIKQRELAADLELLFMCGLHPFTPDTLIEADIADGRVWIRFADTFQRPPTFTPREAVSLVAAASAVLDLPDFQEPADQANLTSALQKLSRALGLEGDDEAVDVELAPAAKEVLSTIREAIDRHRVVKLDYYSYGRDAWSTRSIEPHRIFNAEGQWYVQARAVEVDEFRNFRIDRMREAIVSDEEFAPFASAPDVRVYEARPGDESVVLELEPQARWVVEKYPTESVDDLDAGRMKVALRVSEPAWLERLLLRLGPLARVVEGSVGAAAPAERILQRYESH